jgi:hypothetical protein
MAAFFMDKKRREVSRLYRLYHYWQNLVNNKHMVRRTWA